MMKERKLLIWSAILGLLFIILSYLVHKNVFVSWNYDTTMSIQDKMPKFADAPFSAISFLGNSEVMVLFWFILIAYFMWKKLYKTALACSLFALGVLIEFIAKSIIYQPAPPQFLYRGIFNFSLANHYVYTSFAYPSGHSFRYTFLALVTLFILIKSFKREFIPYLITGFIFLLSLVYISRVSLGEHWTTDVIGGALLGGSFGAIVGASYQHEARQN